MSTSKSTNTRSKASTTGTTRTGEPSTVRAGLRVGEHVVAVQFAVWGPQEVLVRASSGGGRGERPTSWCRSGRA